MHIRIFITALIIFIGCKEPVINQSLDDNGFQVSILASSIGVSSKDIQRVFSLADSILEQKTGENMFIREITNSPHIFVSSYLQDYNTAETSPDGVIVLTEDSLSTTYGGYSYTLPGPPGFVNNYPSPVVEKDRVYVAAIHWNHLFARCGYNDSGNHVSDVSINGECRNIPGTPCVQQDDYWVCSTALDLLYMNNDYFKACTIIHEFLHPFGNKGVYDHYGSSSCIDRTGMTSNEARDIHQFQLNCGMCPDLYENFSRVSPNI